MQTPLPTFKDPALEKQLIEQGYITTPFFNHLEVQDLLDFYTSFTAEYTGNIDRASSHSSNIEYKRKVNAKIKDAYSNKVQELFIDPLIMGGAYVVKQPGSGVSHPHLDWSLVEEGPFRSCNIWIPLIDLTEENGVIEVLPESHKLFTTYRGPNIPDRANDLQQFFWDTMIQLYLKAGTALIYDHRLIHGSRDNLSAVLRPATACAVTNLQANLRLYYMDEDSSQIEAFTGDNAEYLLSNSRFSKPTKMESLGIVDKSDHSQLTVEDYDFLNLDYPKLKPKEKEEPGFLSKISALFKAGASN
ncbi:MAG: hypothetical protein ACI9EQ_000328 [Bacteroidia bacterium]|jgi:hypothetical protein